jgi:Xaa-Pro aminopeptidase
MPCSIRSQFDEIAMLTTHPSIMLGSYLWDEDRLPRDEFDIRLAPLRDAMASNDWAAMLLYGDAREHQALAYFTNFIPRMRWALALIPAQGEPLLLASMSSRDMPAMHAMTWVPDVKSGWEWKWFDEFCAKLPAGTLATIGFDLMTPVLFGQVEKTIAGRFVMADADRVAADARSVHRPREIALIRAASVLASAAAKKIAERWRAGDDVENGVLSGERVARDMAAQDVRTLVSRDGGRTLEPYGAHFDDRPKSLLAYIAVKYMGYWAESFVSLLDVPNQAAQRARAGLDVLLAGLKPDASVPDLAKSVEAAAGSQHPALGGSRGHRIGLSPHEGEDLHADSAGRIAVQTVYALRVGALAAGNDCAVASAMAWISRSGAVHVLSRNDPELR